MMTKGDKIKLRAELAGKAMAAMIGSESILKMSNQVIEAFPDTRRDGWVASQSVRFADALMAELGLSLDKEPEHDPTLKTATLEQILGEED